MERYNGWANRQTWTVNLWLNNEPGTYEYLDELTHGGRQRLSKYEAADVLKDFVTESLAPDLGATMFSDLLTHALALVDWDEIIASNSDEENDDDEE